MLAGEEDRADRGIYQPPEPGLGAFFIMEDYSNPPLI
jgi:hypothetical protein